MQKGFRSTKKKKKNQIENNSRVKIIIHIKKKYLRNVYCLQKWDERGLSYKIILKIYLIINIKKIREKI